MVIKRKIKISIDLAMTVILPLLMAYEMIGAAFHELVGSLMFILFIVHNILNYKLFRYIFKGSYAFSRIFCTIINISIFVIMIALKISGIMMSRYVFTFFL